MRPFLVASALLSVAAFSPAALAQERSECASARLAYERQKADGVAREDALYALNNHYERLFELRRERYGQMPSSRDPKKDPQYQKIEAEMEAVMRSRVQLTNEHRNLLRGALAQAEAYRQLGCDRDRKPWMPALSPLPTVEGYQPGVTRPPIRQGYDPMKNPNIVRKMEEQRKREEAAKPLSLEERERIRANIMKGHTPPPEQPRPGMRPAAPVAQQPAPRPATPYAAWMTGSFTTSFGNMRLSPGGGNYENYGGTLTVDNIEGATMEGRWTQTDSGGQCQDKTNRGRFRFTFTETGFTGSWSYCDKTPDRGGWNGTRIK